MPRNNGNRDSARKNAARSNTQPSVLRRIASQIRRMNDADVYALTLSTDRNTRDLAMRDAHRRAEAYALSADNNR